MRCHSLRSGLRQSRSDRRRVVGDGEAETGPLATAWHSNKFLNPVHDGAVLPILHLNGYKIANPTILARIPQGRVGRSSSGATATSPISSKATIRTRCTSRWPRRSTPASPRSRRSRPTRAQARFHEAPGLADDRAALAEGLDRAERSRWPEDRRLLALAPGAAWPTCRTPGM